jgi:hypothetical protein
MMPRVELPPGIPFTSQAIVAPLARQNEAENICRFPSATLAEEGVTEFVAAQIIVVLALPDFELSAKLAAEIVTVAGDGGTAGAV